MDILELLIKHELAIKELYETFATIFKNHTSFWQELANDEQKHADRLLEFRSNPTTNNWLRSASKFKAEAINTSIGYIENQISQAKKGNFNILQALSIAKDIESALLERIFHKLKDSALKEIESVLIILAEETEKHLRKVIQMHMSEKKQYENYNR